MKVPFFIKIGPLLLKQFDWFREYRLEFGAILKVIKFDFISQEISGLNNSWFIFYLVIENALSCPFDVSEIWVYLFFNAVFIFTKDLDNVVSKALY